MGTGHLVSGLAAATGTLAGRLTWCRKGLDYVPRRACLRAATRDRAEDPAGGERRIITPPSKITPAAMELAEWQLIIHPVDTLNVYTTGGEPASQ